ncbi:MAG TPA: 5-(carboxyamino)imidazole ribonucleotide synthase [Methylomirabilota bacterium]|nr:5-(carboxyamino)imidazole ribonucleotide synthase [Methylomirabilota bacterium]
MQETPFQTIGRAPRIGIIGGGQLARMTAGAALQLGCELAILERSEGAPASRIVAEVIHGDWDDPKMLLKLASRVDVLTLENEFVDANSLAKVEDAGHKLWPTSATMRLIQDKLLQKEAMAKAGLKTARFKATPNREAVAEAGAEFGWPLVLKARRNGYDGKGNHTVRSEKDIEEAWTALRGDSNGLYAEEFCPFAAELAIIVTRARNGELAVYPLVESVQKNHICHLTKAPAGHPEDVTRKAMEAAQRAISAIEGVGSFGVEMFLTRGNEILINELAPRVHNTGHYTIEGCECSQFENHVRAILGWPLGSTRMTAPAAVMVNLLGDSKGPGMPSGLTNALSVPGAYIHIYGKTSSNKGRKMGHVTALGSSVEEALAKAQRAAEYLKFGQS